MAVAPRRIHIIKSLNCAINILNADSYGLCDTDKNRDVKVYNGIGAKVGEEAYVVLETKKAITLAFITFILPIILMAVLYKLTNNGTINLQPSTEKYKAGGVIFVQGTLENAGTIINKGANISGTYDSDGNYGNFISGGRTAINNGTLNNSGTIINEPATVQYADGGRLDISYKGIVNNNTGGTIICKGAVNEGIGDIENQWGNRVNGGNINL
jgi:hypothetical protein